MYYPAIITSALFVGILISDIFSGKRGSIPEHLVLGFISVTLMVWLSMKNAEIVAWGLLMIPLFILAITFIFVIFNVSLGSTPTNSTNIVNVAGQYTLVVINSSNSCTNSAVVSVVSNTNAPIVTASNTTTLTCLTTTAQLTSTLRGPT